jgi:hypothetical protein
VKYLGRQRHIQVTTQKNEAARTGGVLGKRRGKEIETVTDFFSIRERSWPPDTYEGEVAHQWQKMRIDGVTVIRSVLSKE